MDRTMAWADITQPVSEQWEISGGDTIWDGGDTLWDVIGNVEQTEWDVPTDAWIDATSGSESWTDV